MRVMDVESHIFHAMPRYKPQDRNGLLLPVVLSEQIIPGRKLPCQVDS